MSGRKQLDETLFCERCGISFLWPVEEQKSPGEQRVALPAPTLCPGCRHLLPLAGRERGLVKFFNGRKQFGFLTRRNDAEIFVHGSAVSANQRLTMGDLVEFTIIQTDRGPAAGEVVVLEKAGKDEKVTR
jgi:cold shock protein